jgi:hypothetical protein
MKTPVVQLIKAELVSEEFNSPLMTICKISRTFINRDLVCFVSRLLSESKNIVERELILIRLKKLIIQTPREIDEVIIEAQPEQYAQFLKEIEKEQEFFEPIRWIDAELDYLSNIKSKAIGASQVTSNDIQLKEWLNKIEVMNQFKFSKSTLNRRIADGMPATKIGKTVVFNRQKVNDWLAQLP